MIKIINLVEHGNWSELLQLEQNDIDWIERDNEEQV